MGSLIADTARALFGLGAFHLIAWVFVSILLLSMGPMFVQVAPKLYGPPAKLAANDPMRMVWWSAGFIALLLLTTLVAMATVIVAAPVLLVLLVVAFATGFVGYFALAWLIGERILVRTRSLQVAPPAWLSTLVGLIVIRIVRLVPVVGGMIHALVIIAGCGACAAVSWRLALAWHRRRMPDAQQFAGETLVEWYPDGDPADGRPAVQTGRPVLDNVRGEEDRARRSDVDEDSSPQL
jgi:hypothetical protein